MTLKQKFVIGVGAILCIGLGFGTCYYIIHKGLRSATMSGYGSKDVGLKYGEICLRDDPTNNNNSQMMKIRATTPDQIIPEYIEGGKSATVGTRPDLQNNFATEGDLIILPSGEKYKTVWKSVYDKDWIMMYNTYMTKLSQNWLLGDLKYYLIYDDNKEDIGCFDLQKIE